MRITTKNGYDFFEASSALQKAIRLSDEDNAIFFMVELYNSNYDNYVWSRLKIITSEDIGLAKPDAPAVIQSLYSMYIEQKEARKEKQPERLFLVNAVLYLCRCPKSRLVDWTLINAWREHQDNLRPVPDYALDMHNLRGKQKGRGIDHFFIEGTKLVPHRNLDGEREAKDKAHKLMQKYPKPNLPERKSKKDTPKVDLFAPSEEE